MFIGHFAAALAAKKLAPQTSLGTLFLAAQLPDVIWPVLVLTGAETVEIHPGDTAFTPLNFVSYPWSHSLLMVTVTAAAAGLAYARLTKYRTGGVVFAALAVSHWILDWLTHRPDLPLVPHGAVHGLGLWNSVPATLLIEGGMFLAGVALYVRGTKAMDRTGRYAFWALVLFLAGIYAADRFSPPPPSVVAVALVGAIATPGLFFWAAWADRHRQPA